MNDLSYHLVAGSFKFILIFNCLLFIILQSSKLEFLHLKKLKNWFSLSSFLLVTVLPGLFFNFLFQELYFADDFYKDS